MNALLNAVYNKAGQDIYGTLRGKRFSICKDIAQELDVSHETVYRWYSGRTTINEIYRERLEKLWLLLNGGKL